MPHDDTVMKAMTEKGGAVFISFYQDLCDQTSCEASTGPGWRDLLQWDRGHFTVHGFEIVARFIWPGIVSGQEVR